MKSIAPSAVVATVLQIAAPAALACSSCGCLLNTDWASQGYKTREGLSADFRFDYSSQNQLRTGTSVLDRAAIDPDDTDELQRTTITRTWQLTLDYAPSADWGFSATVPYLIRTHDTQPSGPSDSLISSNSKTIGDLRLSARYQGFAPNSPFGVLFGIKLPTGPTNIEFSDGSPLDRGLQPGTGSTDLIVGFYHFNALTERAGYFVQAQWQQAVTKKDDFKPGAQATASVGLRYGATSTLDPHIQLNYRREGRESGANADVDNSGSTLVYLSPGINVDLHDGARVYAFVQVPVYQKVEGRQLEPRYTVSVGLRQQF